MKSILSISLVALLSSQVNASHFDDIESIEGLKWDTIKFKTKKDCALDNYPEVSKPNISFVKCF